MSDHGDGSGGGRGAGENRFDVVERLRRKLAESRAAEVGGADVGGGASNVVRLPKRPRRRQEDTSADGGSPWGADGEYDPAATRPVTRAELQRESGSFPVNPAAWSGAEGGEGAGQDASLIDFDASRRKRAGADGRPGGSRRMVRPRRIGSVEGVRGDDGEAGSSRPDEPGR